MMKNEHFDNFLTVSAVVEILLGPTRRLELKSPIVGSHWIKDNLGIVSHSAWSIDPFGQSPTVAYLRQRMGFKNMLIQRTHYEVKKALSQTRNLEFTWRQNWDKSGETDIFCHMMPFYSYDVPHSCGPDPSLCCQFDFARLPPSRISCPWRKSPKVGSVLFLTSFLTKV